MIKGGERIQGMLNFKHTRYRRFRFSVLGDFGTFVLKSRARFHVYSTTNFKLYTFVKSPGHK